MRSRRAERLLARLFLGQLLEPETHGTDSRAWLPAIAAALVTLPTFVTLLLSIKYLFQPFQSAGWTAVTALDDQLLYVGWSMGVLGLLAIAVWDALGLDASDASILAPLPIGGNTLARARLAAIAVFVAAATVALDALPAVLHPVLVAAKLPLTTAVVIRLMAAHAVANAAAALFGFCSILTVRELTRAVLPPAAFARVSAGLRTTLLVLLTLFCLVLPALPAGTAGQPEVRSPSLDRWFAPLWFVGLHEALGGRSLDTLPRPTLPSQLGASEAAATALYRASSPLFSTWASAAAIGTGLVFSAGLALFFWNARRLPDELGMAAAARGRRVGSLSLSRALCAGRAGPLRAGVSFGLAALSRHLPQRAAIAGALGAGLAVTVVLIRASRVSPGAAADAPLALLAVQPVLLMALAVGLRAALRTAADPAGAWIFRVAPAEGLPGFAAGVYDAARALLLLVVVALIPLHAGILGWPVALRHAAAGVAVAITLHAALIVQASGIPLVYAQAGDRNLATIAPVALLAGVLGVAGVAWSERLLLHAGAVAWGLILGLWLLGWWTWWWLRSPTPPDLNGVAEEPGVQPLGLTE